MSGKRPYSELADLVREQLRLERQGLDNGEPYADGLYRVSQLIGAGVELNQDNPDEPSVWDRLISSTRQVSRQDYIFLLIKHGANPLANDTVFNRDLLMGSNSSVDALFMIMGMARTENAGLHAMRSGRGQNPLHILAQHATRIMQDLLCEPDEPDNEAPVAWCREARSDGNTALHVLWKRVNKGMDKLFLGDGELARDCSSGDIWHITNALIKRGADYLAINDEGQSAAELIQKAMDRSPSLEEGRVAISQPYDCLWEKIQSDLQHHQLDHGTGAAMGERRGVRL